MHKQKKWKNLAILSSLINSLWIKNIYFPTCNCVYGKYWILYAEPALVGATSRATAQGPALTRVPPGWDINFLLPSYECRAGFRRPRSYICPRHRIFLTPALLYGMYSVYGVYISCVLLFSGPMWVLNLLFWSYDFSFTKLFWRCDRSFIGK